MVISLNQKVSSETNTSFVIDKGENLYSVLAELEDKYDLHSTWWVRFNYIFKEAPVIKSQPSEKSKQYTWIWKWKKEVVE